MIGIAINPIAVTVTVAIAIAIIMIGFMLVKIEYKTDILHFAHPVFGIDQSQHPFFGIVQTDHKNSGVGILGQFQGISDQT